MSWNRRYNRPDDHRSILYQSTARGLAKSQSLPTLGQQPGAARSLISSSRERLLATLRPLEQAGGPNAICTKSVATSSLTASDSRPVTGRHWYDEQLAAIRDRAVAPPWGQAGAFSPQSLVEPSGSSWSTAREGTREGTPKTLNLREKTHAVDPPWAHGGPWSKEATLSGYRSADQLIDLKPPSTKHRLPPETWGGPCDFCPGVQSQRRTSLPFGEAMPEAVSLQETLDAVEPPWAHGGLWSKELALPGCRSAHQLIHPIMNAQARSDGVKVDKPPAAIERRGGAQGVPKSKSTTQRLQRETVRYRR